MRQIDQAERHAPLPPPIRKPAETATTPDSWTPITSTPGYEKNQSGDVRKQPPQSIHELYGMPKP